MQLPFVLFFNLEDDDVKDVKVIELQQSDISFAFHELYEVLENYVEKLKISSASEKLKKSNVFNQYLEPIPKIVFEKFTEYLIEKSLSG